MFTNYFLVYGIFARLIAFVQLCLSILQLSLWQAQSIWTKLIMWRSPTSSHDFLLLPYKQPNDFFSKPKCNMCQAHQDGTVCVECKLSEARHLTCEGPFCKPKPNDFPFSCDAFRSLFASRVPLAIKKFGGYDVELGGILCELETFMWLGYVGVWDNFRHEI